MSRSRYLCYNAGMSTIQITLPETLQRFVQNKVAELGLDRPDQYVEKLIEEAQRDTFDDCCMEKVKVAIDRGEWIAEEKFWKLVDEDTQTRRNAQKVGAAR